MSSVYKTLKDAASLFPQFARVPGPEHQTIVEQQSETQLEQVNQLAEDFGQVGSAFSGAECLDNTPGCGSAPASRDWLEQQAPVTSNQSITRDDQDHVHGIGCCKTGTISYRVKYDLGWFYDEQTWISIGLAANQWVGEWNLDIAGGADFWFQSELFGFNAGDKGGQCAWGNWN